jgi:hypothetical protein
MIIHITVPDPDVTPKTVIGDYVRSVASALEDGRWAGSNEVEWHWSTEHEAP